MEKIVSSSWHDYPSVYSIGHRFIKDIFNIKTKAYINKTEIRINMDEQEKSLLHFFVSTSPCLFEATYTEDMSVILISKTPFFDELNVVTSLEYIRNLDRESPLNRRHKIIELFLSLI